MNKFFFFFLFLLYLCSVTIGQPRNGGFESWTAGSPDYWLTNNVTGYTFFTQSSISHSGLSALRADVVNSVAPVLYSHSSSNGTAFPVKTRYNSMKFFLKFIPTQGANFSISVKMISDDEPFGFGVFNTAETINDYTEISIPIEYNRMGIIPNLCLIKVTIDNPHDGSVFYLDDISLSEVVTGVDDHTSPLTFDLQQNFPNPFNPSTSIIYAIPERTDVVLKVYDILGKEIELLVNENKEAGTHSIKFDASALPSGMYLYSIKAGTYTSTRKMILTK